MEFAKGKAINWLLDEGNSSVTPLAGNAVFTGKSVSVKEFGSVNVSIFSDQDSATSGVALQFSPDGANWDKEFLYTYTKDLSLSKMLAIEMRYFRIVYTNGATNQTTFRLHTTFYRVHRTSNSGSDSSSASSEQNYLVNIDEVSDEITYFGFAAPGTASAATLWRIKKMTVSGSLTVVQYASGTSDFDKSWDLRATYTYS